MRDRLTSEAPASKSEAEITTHHNTTADRQTFEKYWNDTCRNEDRDAKYWRPVYTNALPPRHVLLREERLPSFGDYGCVGKDLKINCRIRDERFVLMLMEYLELNRPGLFDVMAIDVDCNFDIRLLEGSGIPLPRYFVGRRQHPGDSKTYVRRPHLVYWLRRPVRRATTTGPNKAERYLSLIHI